MGLNLVTEFGEKHSDSVKLIIYSYCLTYELYEFVKKTSRIRPIYADFGYRINAKFRFGFKFGRITVIKYSIYKNFCKTIIYSDYQGNI